MAWKGSIICEKDQGCCPFAKVTCKAIPARVPICKRKSEPKFGLPGGHREGHGRRHV